LLKAEATTATAFAAAASQLGQMASADIPIEGKTVKALSILSLKRTYDLFSNNLQTVALPADEERCGRRPVLLPWQW